MINTNRLFIRELLTGDRQAMQKIAIDFLKSEYVIYDIPLPVEEEKIKELTKQFSESHLFFAVMLEEVMIGYVCFHEENGNYDLGYCFHSDYHGKGYAYEACFAAMDHISKTRDVKAFTAGTALKNVPSCKLLEKLGFVLTQTETLSFHKDKAGNDIVFEGGIYRKEIQKSEYNMITVKIIDREHKDDINIPNQPFKLFGRMIPSYTGEKWSYEVERLPEADITEMCFPDENYDYDELAKNSIFVGAYDGDECIGLAILKHEWHKFLYLYDLKVNADYREKGIGAKLIGKSKEIALKHGYRGLYTQGQDNNLAACLFYIKNGFVIGGLDTKVYTGTSQEGKVDILFYLNEE